MNYLIKFSMIGITILLLPQVLQAAESDLDHREQVLTYEKKFSAEQDQEKALMHLRDMEQYIRRNVTAPEHKAEYLMRLGHKYYRINHMHKALSFFNEVNEMPGIGTLRQLDAMRMIGQTGLSLGQDHEKTSRIYSEMLEKINTSEDPKLFRFLENAYDTGARAYGLAGDYETAVEMRKDLLQDSRIQLSADQRSWVTARLASDLIKLKRYQEAVGAYESIFDENPSFGYHDGTIINFKLAWVRAHGHEFGDPEAIDLLEQIWTDHTLKDFPRIVAVGQQLAVAYSRQDNHLQEIKIRNELLERLESFYETGTDSVKESIAHVYNENLRSLIERHHVLGNIDASRDLCEKYLRIFPDSESASYIRNKINILDSKAPDNLLLMSEDFGTTQFTTTSIDAQIDLNEQQEEHAFDLASTKSRFNVFVFVISLAIPAIILVYLGIRITQRK